MICCWYSHSKLFPNFCVPLNLDPPVILEYWNDFPNFGSAEVKHHLGLTGAATVLTQTQIMRNTQKHTTTHKNTTNQPRNTENQEEAQPLVCDSATTNEDVRRSATRSESQWESGGGGRFVVVVDFLDCSVKSIQVQQCEEEEGISWRRSR